MKQMTFACLEWTVRPNTMIDKGESRSIFNEQTAATIKPISNEWQRRSAFVKVSYFDTAKYNNPGIGWLSQRATQRSASSKTAAFIMNRISIDWGYARFQFDYERENNATIIYVITIWIWLAIRSCFFPCLVISIHHILFASLFLSRQLYRFFQLFLQSTFHNKINWILKWFSIHIKPIQNVNWIEWP